MADLADVFDEYERLLLSSPAAVRFQVIKRRVIDREGFIRIRVELTDGDLLEFSEYWHETASGDPVRDEYTYHWQDAEGSLISRWDSAKHFPNLPYRPHHVHRADGSTEGNAELPTLQSILKQIEGLE